MKFNLIGREELKYWSLRFVAYTNYYYASHDITYKQMNESYDVIHLNYVPREGQYIFGEKILKVDIQSHEEINLITSKVVNTVETNKNVVELASKMNEQELERKNALKIEHDKKWWEFWR